MPNRWVNYFAIYSLFTAFVHFVLETWYTVQFGQSWLGLLPDYISVSLMTLGGAWVLKDPRSFGLLSGAWGFAFCLNYRAWAWRLQEVLDGTASSLIDNTMLVLSFTLILALVSFIIALVFCLPKRS